MHRVRFALVALLATAALLLGACSDDDDDADNADPSTEADAGADDTSDGGTSVDPGDDDGGEPPAPAGGSSSGTATFGDEALTIDLVRCFFEEQPRAGLGGVFTHTAQASGSNSAGEEIVIDMSRARGEDGVVSDDISYDVGDPFDQENFVSWGANGPEGLLEFGDSTASGSGVEMTTFDVEGATPTPLTFEFSC